MSIKSEHVVMANRPGCLLFCVVIFVFEKTDVFHQVCYFVRPIYIELEEILINNKDTIKPELLQQFGCDDDDYVQITVSPERLRLSRNKCFILLVENKSFSSTDYCRKKIYCRIHCFIVKRKTQVRDTKPHYRVGCSFKKYK